MIIFLCGPDDYHREKKLKEIVAQYCAKHSALASEVFDGSTLLTTSGSVRDMWPKLKQFVEARSLFDEWRLAVVRGVIFGAGDKESKGVLEAAKNNDRAVVIISAEKAPMKDFSFLTRRPVVNQKFPLLHGAVWRKFVEKEAAARAPRLPKPIVALIANSYVGDCWSAINELEKLKLAPSGQELALVEQSAHPDFFKSVQELTSSNLAQRLVVLEQLLATEDGAKIFNVLAYTVSPQQQIKMADYDIAIKSGKMNYAEALLDFIL